MATDPITESWLANADAWTHIVRSDGIASRRLGTNAAIVETLVRLAPATLLDVGCGEGWLCRELSARGADCIGVDASAPLVEAARSAGGGRFEVADYASLSRGDTLPGPFDAIACNFALLDEHIVPLLVALRQRLGPGGRLLIHTVHPWQASDGEYADGWRVETFAAFEGARFPSPMPWYFRTLPRWVADLGEAGLVVESLHEPRNPNTGQPLSLLIVAAPRAA